MPVGVYCLWPLHCEWLPHRLGGPPSPKYLLSGPLRRKSLPTPNLDLSVIVTAKTASFGLFREDGFLGLGFVSAPDSAFLWPQGFVPSA